MWFHVYKSGKKMNKKIANFKHNLLKYKHANKQLILNESMNLVS